MNSGWYSHIMDYHTAVKMNYSNVQWNGWSWQRKWKVNAKQLHLL